MVLVNGAEGIGTGWSSSVPNYNPRDIVANLRRLMDDEEPEPMHPWYRGYKGTLGPADGKGTYTSYGTVAKGEGGVLHISELPLRKWTQDYKEGTLEPLLTAEKGEAWVQARLSSPAAALPRTAAPLRKACAWRKRRTTPGSEAPLLCRRSCARTTPTRR